MKGLIGKNYTVTVKDVNEELYNNIKLQFSEMLSIEKVDVKLSDFNRSILSMGYRKVLNDKELFREIFLDTETDDYREAGRFNHSWRRGQILRKRNVSDEELKLGNEETHTPHQKAI